VHYVGGTQKADKDTWFEAVCGKGEYVLTVYTPWKSFVDEFTISAYGPEQLMISQINESEMPQNYYHKFATSKALGDLESGWKTFAAQGHSQIMYKFEHGSDGFGYFVFVNDSDNIGLTITLEFTKRQNLMPLYPYTFDSPMIIVPPKEKESFVYFMIDTPSSISFRLLSSFKKAVMEIKQTVKREGQRYIRKYKQKDVGIYAYGLKHSKGVTWEYENTSKTYVLDETIRFDLHNSWIEGSNDDTVNLYLKPGQIKKFDIIFGSGDNKGAGKVEELKF